MSFKNNEYFPGFFITVAKKINFLICSNFFTV